MQRLGVEVVGPHRALLQHGYGAWRGPLLAADDVRAVITRMEERGLPEVDAVLSGYRGGIQIGDVILDAVALGQGCQSRGDLCLRSGDGGTPRAGASSTPTSRCCCERVVPDADRITPNQFELGFLTGTEPRH